MLKNFLNLQKRQLTNYFDFFTIFGFSYIDSLGTRFGVLSEGPVYSEVD